MAQEEHIKTGGKVIYLDYQATTPLDKRVLEDMLPYFTDHYGNAHSRNHKLGWIASAAIEKAREEVAELINASPKDIIFTSGATESNNIGLKGVANFYGKNNKKNHIITLVTEHKCVINSCRDLKVEGYDVTFLPVEKNGLVNLQTLKEAITDKTMLVSVMTVNNEIGVIQPIKEIGEICREKGVFFHTDAAQAFGKIKLDVEEMNIDLMSISGHKIYGPKGIGALYVRRKKPRVRINSIISGGGQERGMRSGTLATPLIVGLGSTARLAKNEMDSECQKLQKFFDKFYDEIVETQNEVFLNGDKKQRYPGNINLSFACIEGESMIMAINDLAVSSGSACTSATLEGSYVLKALGVSEELAHTSIRFGFGRFTTEEEIDTAIESIKQAITRLREMSPLWEMHQEGIDLSKVQWTEHH